jgi:hypothetical protein
LCASNQILPAHTLLVEAQAGYVAIGDPEWARTTNLQLRRLTLYPIELQGRIRLSIAYRLGAVNPGLPGTHACAILFGGAQMRQIHTPPECDSLLPLLAARSREL